MNNFSIAAISAALGCLSALPTQAATLSSLNEDIVKFTPNTSEANLMGLGVASISFGDTTIYIGTNQVSSNNQDPIVTSFTNGSRNWTMSYDTSGIDARGVGLLWDEASSNLYGVFTADGGSAGFAEATTDGWLSSYGRGGGPVVSVLLKLNPGSGEAEAGTYIRAQLNSGNTNTVRPTGLDFVNNQVVFLGNSFFTPLDANGVPFSDRDESLTSPFEYRVVLNETLTQAISAEAIGWDGVTAFSPLTAEGETDNPDSGESGGAAAGETGGTGEQMGDTDDEGSANPDSEADDAAPDEEMPTIGDVTNPDGDGPIVDDIGRGEEAEAVPEPGILVGLIAAIAIAMRRSRSHHVNSRSASPES